MIKKILTILFGLLVSGGISAKYSYKPAAGDKFQYKISKQGKHFESIFIYDLKDKLPAFHFKWGTEISAWGSWNESKSHNQTIINDLNDTGLLKNCNLIYVSKEIFKQLKSGKNFKLTIQETLCEFKLTKTLDYNLPIEGAEMSFKIVSATSSDNKWIINILDNAPFPLITALLGEVSWQLQTIVPVPMYPITHNLIGSKLEDKNAEMFKTYIKETCVMVEAKYTENFRKVVFNEYFCPIAGVRFSLKNDTIISLQLVSKNYISDGYNWQTYHGYVWGIFRLGDKRKAIEKKYGKPISTSKGKSYYPDKGFYLIFNNKGELEGVEYE